MTDYETGVSSNFDLLASILQEYATIAKNMKSSLKETPTGFDEVEEMFTTAINNLESIFNPEVELEGTKSLSRKIEDITKHWLEAQQNFEDAKKKMFEEFERKFRTANIYMGILNVNLNLYNLKHKDKKLTLVDDVVDEVGIK